MPDLPDDESLSKSRDDRRKCRLEQLYVIIPRPSFFQNEVMFRESSNYIETHTKAAHLSINISNYIFENFLVFELIQAHNQLLKNKNSI